VSRVQQETDQKSPHVLKKAAGQFILLFKKVKTEIQQYFCEKIPKIEISLK